MITNYCLTPLLFHDLISLDVTLCRSSVEPECLLNMREMMRTKMTHDESKLIVSTFRGYILLIHDLDLDNLKENLHG